MHRVRCRASARGRERRRRFYSERRIVRRHHQVMASNGLKIAIVGGGLAGLSAAMKIAESGYAVDLFSIVPVKRSHSVCAQGGINGAVNTKGEGFTGTIENRSTA